MSVKTEENVKHNNKKELEQYLYSIINSRKTLQIYAAIASLLLMSLSTLNSTQPQSEGVSSISATPELPAIQIADNVDESDDDCDIVPPA